MDDIQPIISEFDHRANNPINKHPLSKIIGRNRHIPPTQPPQQNPPLVQIENTATFPIIIKKDQLSIRASAIEFQPAEESRGTKEIK